MVGTTDKRQWTWALKLADPESSKWSAVATKWHPPLHSGTTCGRRQARPKKRWDQDIVDYLARVQPELSALRTAFWNSEPRFAKLRFAKLAF